jgi:DNA-binding FadR family transcriptional regulator
MRESSVGNYDPVEADCRFHESIIAATNNRFYQPLGALVRTAHSLTAPITNAIFGHAVGDLAAHGEVLLAIKRKDEQRAFDLMRGCFPTSQGRSQRLKPCPRFPIVDRPPRRKSERHLLA